MHDASTPQRPRGRPRVAPGPVGTKTPPEARGYHSLRLRADAIAALDRYVLAHQLPGRSQAVLQLIRAVDPSCLSHDE